MPIAFVKKHHGRTLSLYEVKRETVGGQAQPKKESWPFLKVAKTNVQVGQTAIVVEPGAVAVSFVSGLLKGEGGSSFYKLYLDPTDTFTGGPVINVEEQVIGILLSGNTLLPAEEIYSFLTEKSETAETTKETPPAN